LENRLFFAFCAASFLACSGARADSTNAAPVATNQNTSQSTTQNIALNQPFLFAYGTWEKKVRIENGVAILRGEGVSPKGGAGVNLASNLDLSRAANNTPTLRVKIGAGNTMTRLRLLLIDAAGRTANWSFALPPSSTGFVEVTPQNGAPLSKPNEPDKTGQPLNLSKISQYQFGGDWSSDGAIDIEVSAISFVPPTEEVRAQRVALVQQEAADREKLQLEREALRAKYKRNALSPTVSNIAPVATNVLSIEIKSERILPASLTLYVAQSGDVRSEKKDDKGQINEVTVSRGGKDLGWLIGPKRDWLAAREGFEGDPLLEFVADDASNFTVSSSDDTNFAQGVKPLWVARKSTPTNWEGSSDMEMRHTLYLRLPKPLAAGKHYTIDMGALNKRESSTRWVNDAARVRSEAVHVNQIGFRPDDPAKRAFVSCWLGNGGALKLPTTLNFSLIDDKTGKVVWSGQSRDLWPAGKLEQMQTARNFSGTDVMRLDFSSFKTPGRYRVLVAGIGTSFPFEIGRDVWKKAFWVQMKGLYNQRSGTELGPPYTSFKKPRDMNPMDAATNNTHVTWTKYRAIEGGAENFAAIAAGDTGEAAPGWGGYQDAGDWNPRRVTHMAVTMSQLEVFDLFPKTYAALKLNIPQRKGVPDILTEAIFEFETFRRLQQKDGGVGLGLETPGDPLTGEVSWLQSMPIYALSPDYASSWFYAGVGARLSRLLQPYDAELAATYRDSAIAAFNWAEKDFARDKAAGLIAKRDGTWQEIDKRNAAALELYRLTGEKSWHDVFLQDSVLKDASPELFAWGKAVQRNQAFTYATMPANLGDAALKKKAVTAISTLADRALKYASDNAWNLTTPDKGRPQFIGFYSTADATDLVHAHFLTKNPKYLAGAVQATQFQSGANPNNLVYTTGLGANPVQHPLKLDSRRTGQNAPVGLTPYGNIDMPNWGNQQWITWPITYYLSKTTTPHPLEWPTNEAYWDLGGFVALNEFTVDSWAPNITVWGYLAARP